MNVFDTIAAVSSPRGKGGIAVIRISGDRAAEVADKVFRPKNGKLMSEIAPNRQVWGDIFAADDSGESVNVDDGMGVYFKAPHSFTGEDTVEIACHGGVLITQTVLEAVLAAGARPAQAGEFTRRAFISGRMTLTQAEALGELLEAKTERQMVLSRTGVKGILSDKIDGLYRCIGDVLSSIYAKIDFPDEDLADMGRDEIEVSLREIREEASRLASTYKTGRAVKEGIRTVICGRTNAGKSSVYNRILGYEAAIVTDIEGTTRDILREQATLGNTTLILCDTAGIRKTDDKVESIGIERALDEITAAGLCLAVFDSSAPLCDDDLLLIDRLSHFQTPVVALLNKSDLDENTDTTLTLRQTFSHCVSVCADTGNGFDALANAVDALFIDGSIDMDNDAVVTGARQYASLARADEALCASLSELDAGTPLDLCCIGIESAMSSLGEVDGRAIGEDIVSEIFSKFCVGK
jgi:tRNA modification GTPase